MDIDYKKLVKPFEKESIKSLQNWIKIDSTYDEKTKNKDKPFGEGVYKALDYIANLAIKEGFSVDRCDNYCTEISCGTGDKLIGIYAHADVVPVTGKWEHEPFGGEIVDDVMYGRGTSDDKGPAIAALYALKALRDNNMIDGYKVSLVIGGNEESGSLCLDHYFHEMKKPYPTYGFTPDGDFPLIYGEKGITVYEHDVEVKIPNVVSINGGVVPNAVMDEVHCIFNHDENLGRGCQTFFNLTGTKYQLINQTEFDELVVFGKSAHGSVPHLGVNAGLHLLKFLGWYYKDDSLNKLADSYLETTGKKMDCFVEGKYLHGTTYNVGIMNYEKDILKLIVNFRYPENCKPQEIEKKLNKLGLGKVKFYGYGETLLVDPESPMIKTLLKVYQEETGDYKTPIMTIGGGTYAKESKNTVAFGSAFPGKYDHIHEPNEKIDLCDFLLSQSIYARAIYELGKLK